MGFDFGFVWFGGYAGGWDECRSRAKVFAELAEIEESVAELAVE